MLAASVAPFLTRHGIHYGWVMVALTFMTALFSAGAISLPGVLILPLMNEFGWSRSEISGAMALMFILFGGMAPFAGALMLRYGLRRVVAAAATLVVLALGGAALMTEKWHLWLTLGLLLGMAAGTTAMVLSATVANRWFVRRRGLVVGILAAATATGQLIFLPTAAWLVAEFGWRFAVLPGIAGCSMCALLYVLFARDWPADLGLAPFGETRVEPPAAASAGNAISLSFAVLREAVPTRTFWILAGTFFICGLSSSGIVQQHFIPLCADNGLDGVRAASFLAMMGMFNFVGTIISGFLSDRYDNRVLLATYYGLRGLSLMWLPFSDFDIISLTAFAVFFGLDFIATVPPTVKLAGQHFGPQKAAIVFGWAFTSHQVGSAVAALGAGVSRDALATYMPAFFTAGLACLFATIAIFGLRRLRAAGQAA
ncbi:MAG: MFS transporter [Alphaproteobacteria bacterium]